MTKRLDITPLKRRGLRQPLTVLLTLTLVFALLPHGRTQADGGSGSGAGVSKLSVALQQALVSYPSSCVWLDASRQTVRALIQSNGPPSSALTTAITAAGGSVVRQFTSINGLLADLPINKVLTIAGRSDVDRMSADHLSQQSSSHLEVATGADRARTYGGLDGSGVGIAILDSGIMASHSEFGNLGNLLGLSRVTAKTDIASSNVNLAQYLLRLGIVSSLLDLLGLDNGDGYGHGSHVAGAAAGRSNGTFSSRGFNGIAPNANLIDVRVLNSRAIRHTSDAIGGLDRGTPNRTLRNIKVINLSPGAASPVGHITDPLHPAVRVAGRP